MENMEEKNEIDEVKEECIEEVINEPERKVNIGIKIFIGLIVMCILFIGGGFVASNYIIFDKNENINLVINNKNVTGNLKKDIIIKNELIYMSIQDISNFFDKYIYEEEQVQKIITTYRTQIAEVSLIGTTIDINGEQKEMFRRSNRTRRNNIFTDI